MERTGPRYGAARTGAPTLHPAAARTLRAISNPGNETLLRGFAAILRAPATGLHVDRCIEREPQEAAELEQEQLEQEQLEHEQLEREQLEQPEQVGLAAQVDLVEQLALDHEQLDHEELDHE